MRISPTGQIDLFSTATRKRSVVVSLRHILATYSCDNPETWRTENKKADNDQDRGSLAQIQHIRRESAKPGSAAAIAPDLASRKPPLPGRGPPPPSRLSWTRPARHAPPIQESPPAVLTALICTNRPNSISRFRNRTRQRSRARRRTQAPSRIDQ